MEGSASRTTVEEVRIDLRVQRSPDGAADLRVAEDHAAPARPALHMPIRARTRPVGTLQLVGPRAGDCAGADRPGLAAFADEIGIASVTFLLRDSDATWRQIRACVGIVLALVGVSLILGATWALAARALPLSWLPSRPGVGTGAALTATGVLLAAVRH